MNIARNDKNFSLYSNCSNCKYSVERSKFDSLPFENEFLDLLEDYPKLKHKFIERLRGE